MAKRVKPINVLLIEDNPGGIKLILETFKENKLLAELTVIKDGEEAINFLKKRGRINDKSQPELILLDLNLPKLSGQEILAEIKNDKELRKIPVIVLTSSSEESDILKSYDLNASCYITKPVDLEEFVKVVRSIEDFWFTIIKLPG
jgi:CheY-like chemotaxis protein